MESPTCLYLRDYLHTEVHFQSDELTQSKDLSTSGTCLHLFGLFTSDDIPKR